MEVNELTDEQIANLTPEQVTMLENEPDKLTEILAEQAANTKDTPKPAVKDSVANDAGDEEGEPVVLTKNGKGVIPYEKHKELRVDNATLREQLAASQQENIKATEKLEALLQNKEDASGAGVEVADEALKAHLETIKEDMPELHQVISAVLDGSRKQGERLNETLAELKREKEESTRANQLSVEEQVAEAKENNPDLTHWETQDPEAWDEAIKQDEILRTSAKWGKTPYEERFEEVVRRVRAIHPDASLPPTMTAAEQARVATKAKLEKAPARNLTTLSDIQGGANPTSESEQISNLPGLDLVGKYVKMNAQTAAALRADLD